METQATKDLCTKDKVTKGKGACRDRMEPKMSPLANNRVPNPSRPHPLHRQPTLAAYAYMGMGRGTSDQRCLTITINGQRGLQFLANKETRGENNRGNT